MKILGFLPFINEASSISCYSLWMDVSMDFKFFFNYCTCIAKYHRAMCGISAYFNFN